jgi:hypothetical protein
MGIIALITAALKALPQILSMIQGLASAIKAAEEKKLISDTQKAVQSGDTQTVDNNLGATRAGLPSGDAGVVQRPAQKH